MVICLVWMRRLAAGMGVGVRSKPTESFGQGGLMLRDSKHPMNPKETSLITHPNASMKMHDINRLCYIVFKITVDYNFTDFFGLFYSICVPQFLCSLFVSLILERQTFTGCISREHLPIIIFRLAI